LRYGSDFGKLAENDSTQDSVYVLKREGYEKGQNTSDYPEYAKQAKDWEQQGDIALIKGDYVLRELHLKRYELKDHLGNVRVIVADVKDATLGLQGQPREFAAILKHYANYYPFGMEKPAMVYDKGGYRYGFNGKENDDEVKGVGNSVDFGARIYDSRAARFLSIDRYFKMYPFMNPYLYAGNSPIRMVDANGDSLRITYGPGTIEIDKFKNIFQVAFSTEIQVSINSKGMMTLVGDPKKLIKPSEQALYKHLQTVISNPNIIDIKLANKLERKTAINGSFRAATVDGKQVSLIDIEDIESFNVTPVSPHALILHEIWESYLDQNDINKINKGPFKAMHKEALKVQGEVDGMEIKEQGGTLNIDKGFTNYNQNGHKFSVVADIKNRNIISVKPENGWQKLSKDKTKLEKAK